MLMLELVTDKTTWSPTINALVEKGTVDVMPYDLELDYDYWPYGTRFETYDTCTWLFTRTNKKYILAEIIGAILPEKEMQEVPQGFTQVGHVGRFLPDAPNTTLRY